MKIKRYISILLAAIVLFSLTYQTDTFAKTNAKNIYLYYTNNNYAVFNNGKNLASVNITTDGAFDTKSIKCTNSKVAKFLGVKATKNSAYSEIVDGKLVDSETTIYNLKFKLKKAGEAKISFKVGKKKYTTKLHVLNEKNPIKNISITGCRNGKNLSKKIKWDNGIGTLKLKGGTLKNAKLKLQLSNTAKSYSLSVSLNDNTNGISIRPKVVFDKLNQTISLRTLKKGHSYTLSLSFAHKLPDEDIGRSFPTVYSLKINYN